MLLVDGQDLLTRSASGCLDILYLRQDNSDGNLRLRYQTLVSRCQLYTGDPDSSVGPADSRDTAQGMEQAGLLRQCSDKFWGGDRAPGISCGLPNTSDGPAFPRSYPSRAKTWFWQALQKSEKKQHSLEMSLEKVLGTEMKHIAEKILMYSRTENGHL